MRTAMRIGSRGYLALVIALAALLLASGCDRLRRWRAPVPPENVLLLVVDTLRADHLSLYGYTRPTSPRLDALAQSAVVFEQARSQATCTFPSVNSLLTSRQTVAFLGQGYGNFTIPKATPTVAELLHARGWTTFAASASAIVRATPSHINPLGGYGAGFEHFDETCEGREAACLNARLREFLDTHPARFFAYLHYMEPHHPYAPPAGYARRFAHDIPGRAWVLAGNPDPIERALAQGRPPDVTPAELEHLIALYDDEIAYWDTQLARLFADLDRRGLRERTLVMLAADHGEMFLEHGDVKHCRKLYDTVTHTPLVLWIPGARGQRIAEPVENLAVVPTALDYLGVAVPDIHFDGRSLRTMVDGSPDTRPHYAYSAQIGLRSVVDRRYKMIFDVVTRQEQLFDLADDPGELRDRTEALPAERKRLEHALGTWLAAYEGPGTGPRNAGLGEDVERSLRALGYVQ
jgi:arylsulfatase A-like enzyme